MASTQKRTLITEGEELDKQELPVTAIHDPEVARLLRQWEAERNPAAKPKSTLRPAPRREPFDYD
ncbi:MAG: hypothetical protein SNJ72_06315 [Fimbriimonadales bacterium]